MENFLFSLDTLFSALGNSPAAFACIKAWATCASFGAPLPLPNKAGPQESTIFEEEPVDAEYEPPIIIADEILLNWGLK